MKKENRHLTSNKDADKMLKERRIEYVFNLLIRGYRKNEIINICKANKEIDFDLSTRQIQNYIKYARDRILEKAAKDIDYYISRSINRKDDLYKRAFNNKDIKTCNLVDNSLNDLLGINRLRVEMTSNNMNTNIDVIKINEDTIKAHQADIDTLIQKIFA